MGKFNEQATKAEEKTRFFRDVLSMLNGEDDAFIQGVRDDLEQKGQPFKTKITDWRSKYGGDVQVTLEDGEIYDLSKVFDGNTTHSRHLEVVVDEHD